MTDRDWEAGDKAECVEAPETSGLVLHRVYTVDEVFIGEGIDGSGDDVGLVLKEHAAPDNCYGYSASYFRKIRPCDPAFHEEFFRMLTPQRELESQ